MLTSFRTNRLLPALCATAILSILPSSSYALLGFGGSQPQEPLGAVLAEVKGQVEFQAQGQAWNPATAQKPVNTGDQIKTGADGTALVVFLDGSKLRIGNKATFALDSHKAKRVDVRLNVGLLEAWVKKVKNRKFRVRTPTAVASIRGTEFRVEVDPAGETTWDLFGGNLDVADNFGNNVPIDSGQRLIAEPEKGVAEAKPQPIPPEVKMTPEPVPAPPPPQGAKPPVPPPGTKPGAVPPPPGTKPTAPPPGTTPAILPPPPPPEIPVEPPPDSTVLPPIDSMLPPPPPPNPIQDMTVTCVPTVSPSAPCP